MWLCDTCKTPHPTEEKADACRDRHRGPEVMKIVGAHYEPRSKKSAFGRRIVHESPNRAGIPDRLRVKFSDENGDFATYVLEHIGARGV